MYLKKYREIVAEMPQKEISEELSFLLAVKENVTDKYTDYQSVISYMVDSMFEVCHDEVLARVVSGSLAPVSENLKA